MRLVRARGGAREGAHPAGLRDPRLPVHRAIPCGMRAVQGDLERAFDGPCELAACPRSEPRWLKAARVPERALNIYIDSRSWPLKRLCAKGTRLRVGLFSAPFSAFSSTRETLRRVLSSVESRGRLGTCTSSDFSDMERRDLSGA